MKKMSVNSMHCVVALALLILSVPAIAADASVGKQKSALCAGCHGANGISLSPDIPNLAGQKEGYFIKAVKDYKSGARKNPMMASVVGMIPDSDLVDLAAFYASLK